MAKDPAVLFYTSDFLTGTAFFTDEERGQYIRLLCEQHQMGSIPENHMINVCKSKNSQVLKKFKQDVDGNYYNVRMREEAEKRKNFCNSRSNNKSGRPKSNQNSKSYDISYDNRKIIHMENENDNEDININKEIGIVKGKRFVKPTIQEIKNYCKQRNNQVDADKFFDFYESKGWLVGKSPMKSWEAAVRNWERGTETLKKGDINEFSKPDKYEHIGK